MYYKPAFFLVSNHTQWIHSKYLQDLFTQTQSVAVHKKPLPTTTTYSAEP